MGPAEGASVEPEEHSAVTEWADVKQVDVERAA